jgi:hypothetical protein
MKNLVWQRDVDINEVFPQSYDLTDPASEEFKDFMAEMKFGQMVASLKMALNQSPSTLSKHMERIAIAIGFIERRCRLMSSDLLTPSQDIIVPGSNNELDIVDDAVYYHMVDSRGTSEFSRAPWFLKLCKTSAVIKDLTPKNAKLRINLLLNELKAAMGEH